VTALPIFPAEVRCETCQHWQIGVELRLDDGVRRCRCLHMTRGTPTKEVVIDRTCRDEKFSQPRPYTRGDFGCRLWQARPPCDQCGAPSVMQVSRTVGDPCPWRCREHMNTGLWENKP
jgi:hypothetical protein